MIWVGIYTLPEDPAAQCRLQIDQEAQVVRINDQYCPLTEQEYRLLHQLARHANTPVSRRLLLQEAWGYALPGATRTVDVHIQRLRRKIHPLMIRTIFGKGYMLPLDEAQPAPPIPPAV